MDIVLATRDSGIEGGRDIDEDDNEDNSKRGQHEEDSSSPKTKTSHSNAEEANSRSP